VRRAQVEAGGEEEGPDGAGGEEEGPGGGWW